MKPTAETIIETIAEFDRLGLEAFLAKYEKGHHPTTYLLKWKNKTYPMKALWVASHRPAADPSRLDYREALKGFPKLGFEGIVNLKQTGHSDLSQTPAYADVIHALNEFALTGARAFVEKYARSSVVSKYVKHQQMLVPMMALWNASLRPQARSASFNIRSAELGFEALGFKIRTVERDENGLQISSLWEELNYEPELRDDESTEFLAQEGERIRREAEVIKRNKAIVRAAKRRHGPTCQACCFDFGKFYGEIGVGFIEAHHINPLSERDGVDEPTSVADFAMLCSNCHRMIHSSSPCLTVEELKQKIGVARRVVEVGT